MSGLERMVSLLKSESGISRLGYIIVVGGTALLLGSGLAGRYASEMKEVRYSELKARAVEEAQLEDKKSEEVAVELLEIIEDGGSPFGRVGSCRFLAKIEEAKRYRDYIKSIYGKEFFIKHADKFKIADKTINYYGDYRVPVRWFNPVNGSLSLFIDPQRRLDEYLDAAWEIYSRVCELEEINNKSYVKIK